jgi:hypothetical protein
MDALCAVLCPCLACMAPCNFINALCCFPLTFINGICALPTAALNTCAGLPGAGANAISGFPGAVVNNCSPSCVQYFWQGFWMNLWEAPAEFTGKLTDMFSGAGECMSGLGGFCPF